MQEETKELIRHWFKVEGLAKKAIARRLGVHPKTVRSVLKLQGFVPKKAPPPSQLDSYKELIRGWYQEHSELTAQSVYQRLKPLDYKGSYGIVRDFTQPLRAKRKEAFLRVETFPGEEAQVDWATFELVGGQKIYLFAFVLSYSRYLFARFYPRMSFEFFLKGHIEAFEQIGGVTQKIRYDNLRSVVIKRMIGNVQLNPKFLAFASHYGFRCSPCNVRRGNEKGKVERSIRYVRENFWMGTDLGEIEPANRELINWLSQIANVRIQRTTRQRPLDRLKEEKLLSLPRIAYRPCQIKSVDVGKDVFLTVDTNRYSLPHTLVGKTVTVAVYPEVIEVLYKHQVVARHIRYFEKYQKYESLSHREEILMSKPGIQRKKIYDFLYSLHTEVKIWLEGIGFRERDILAVSQQLLKLVQKYGKVCVISAIRELNRKKDFDIAALKCRLERKKEKDIPLPVKPHQKNLLELDYEKTDLCTYEPE